MHSFPTKESVHQALKEWQRGDSSTSPFSGLLLFQQACHEVGVTTSDAIDHVLKQGLGLMDEEGEKGHQYVTLLEMRFLADRPAHQVAVALAVAEGSVYRQQALAIERLTTILQQLEACAQAQRAERLVGRLESATYSHLIGRERQLALLRNRITQPGPPWQFAIEGIGGIGKTSFADRLVRSLIGDAYWRDFAWVTARQQIFNGGGAVTAIARPALTTEVLIDELMQQLWGEEVEIEHLVHPQKMAMIKERLRDRPHLIVIDNLETVLDVESLLGCLRELTNPTKFLLTTRHSRFGEAGIYHFALPELAKEDALVLIRQEADLRNVSGIHAASDDDLMPIVATVGGNPLALRLVVGQLHTHTLRQVLDNLQNARGQQARAIYTYIYHQAWQELDEVARRVLLLLPLALESGSDFDYLAAIGSQAGLSTTQLDDALTELIVRNLVDSRGDLMQRRYSIHNLTRAFLHQQVLGWVDEN